MPRTSAEALQLPRVVGAALTLRRRAAGFLLTVVALPLLTWLLILLRPDDALTTEVLAFQLLAVIVALVGGIWPAVTAAIGAAFAVDFFFVPPLYQLRIASPAHLASLLIFVVVAVLVSLVVDLAASRSREARRSAAESRTLANVAVNVIRGENVVEALVDRLRDAFGLSAVALSLGCETLYESGSADDDEDVPSTAVRFGDDGTITLTGRDLDASDRRILDAFVSQIEAALHQRDLRTQAEGIRPLEEADRLRTALLAAVGHDLRTPLSSATAAVSSLRSTDVAWSSKDRDDLLETAELSLHRLALLVSDLLDASRLQAGVLPISLSAFGLDDVVPLALDELGLSSESVTMDVPSELPEATGDPVLLQRVLVNLLSNAARYSPAGVRPVVSGSTFGDRVELRVIDRGPGIPPDQLADAFRPFQRLGDTDATTGVGLGLALAKGFIEAMGGTLEAQDTPGGGLTMVVSLPVASRRRGV